LSGKVTVTASPCTGWAHHAQGRTGCPCRHHGRVTFALLLPFRRSTGVTPPTRPGPETPPAHAGSMTPLPQANEWSAGRRAEARDAREDGVPISWPWSVACSTGEEQMRPQNQPQPWSVLALLAPCLWTGLGEDHEVFGMVAPFGLLRNLPTRQLPVVPRSQACEWRTPHRTRGVLLGGVGGASVRRSWAICHSVCCVYRVIPLTLPAMLWRPASPPCQSPP